MFNKLYLKFKRITIVAVLFILITHFITVVCTYAYLTREDYSQKKENIGNQIANHLSLQLNMIEEVATMYCNDGRIGDSILDYNTNFASFMRNILSSNENIVNYAVLSKNQVYFYTSDAYEIYRKFFDELIEKNFRMPKKWILYNEISEGLLFCSPILSSKGDICGSLILEISTAGFKNKLFDNACVYINDSKNNMVIVGDESETIDDVFKSNKNNYTNHSYMFGDDLQINISFSFDDINSKIINLVMILILEYLAFFILSVYVVNEYSKYIRDSVFRLHMDMDSFMNTLQKP